MGWYSNFSRKLFMALASGGRFQTVCDCESPPHWEPGSYLADSLVIYTNPNTNEESLYRARGDIQQDHHTDLTHDQPGKSIHWELVCVCEELGFTPTPTPTPTEVTLPTPTSIFELPTPTPTPRFRCEDYEMWNPDKQVPPGLPHYVYKQRVQWHGNVYEARDIEGTEPDDIPGISNHWILLFSCSECICAPDAFDHVILGDYKTNFEHGETTGFLSGIKFSYDSSEFEYDSAGITLQLSLKNSNVSGEVRLEKLTIPFTGVHLYMEYNGICYYTLAKSKNGNTKFELDVISFPEICPTPTPRPDYICGEGYLNIFETDGISGIHEPNKGLSAELFDAGGKLYYNDIEISSLDDAMVFASSVWKNEESETPFGVLVVTGKFSNHHNTIVYEAPDGTCWKGKIQPFGKNIVMYRIY